MRGIKTILIAVAVLTAVGGALAAKKPVNSCEYSTQYYLVGSTYVEAGTIGENYYCWTSPPDICTYYKPDPVWQPNYYEPCYDGLYEEIPE